jgi:hypothetical protein
MGLILQHHAPDSPSSQFHHQLCNSNKALQILQSVTLGLLVAFDVRCNRSKRKKFRLGIISLTIHCGRLAAFDERLWHSALFEGFTTMSGPLVPNQSSPSSVSQFHQLGTMNWVDLGSKTIGFALEALNRYSKAEIDVATVGISKFIFRPFLIPTEKKKELLHRIENLPRVAMNGRVAQFGFGLQHILADFAETDEGLACVALCVCLTASYDSFYGAQVLRYLCICQNAPEDMVPGTKR